MLFFDIVMYYNFFSQKLSCMRYQEFELLIANILFFDVRRYLKNIKTAPHRF